MVCDPVRVSVLPGRHLLSSAISVSFAETGEDRKPGWIVAFWDWVDDPCDSVDKDPEKDISTEVCVCVCIPMGFTTHSASSGLRKMSLFVAD